MELEAALATNRAALADALAQRDALARTVAGQAAELDRLRACRGAASE